MMNFVFKMMDFVFKMMDFVFKMMNFVKPEQDVGILFHVPRIYLQSEREIYQSPACIYNIGERSINPGHVYTWHLIFSRSINRWHV